MPVWFVNFGRYVGGLLVFSLCAALSGTALLPCRALFLIVEQNAGPTWAVFSVPFLYGVWGWCYCAQVVVFKRLVFHPKEGEAPLFSAATIGWALTGGLTNFANTLFLPHWRGTPFLNLYLRAMGAKIGRNVSINTVHVYEWDLLHIDDGAVLGGDSCVQAHILESGKMKMKRVYIGKRALIGTGAKVMPGCVVEDLGILAAGTIMRKDQRVEAGAIYGGLPAKFIRQRGAKDADDDGITRGT